MNFTLYFNVKFKISTMNMYFFYNLKIFKHNIEIMRKIHFKSLMGPKDFLIEIKLSLHNPNITKTLHIKTYMQQLKRFLERYLSL